MIGASGGEGDGGEYLIILEPAAATEALEQLRSSHRVIQVGSPRVVAVVVSPGETPPSSETPGVVAVSGGALPKYSGPTGPQGSGPVWVFTQSPQPGVSVTVGDTVKMNLRRGRIQ